jgi:hypothetical protein
MQSRASPNPTKNKTYHLEQTLDVTPSVNLSVRVGVRDVLDVG